MQFGLFNTFVIATTIVLGVVAQKLNVHVMPHTHDDPGWLKTADQYFYGSNSSITKAGVQYILDTVVESLVKDSKRKFVYVEMSFFQRWYEEQSLGMREVVKGLVKNGQLSFANGGWVMHDEAGSHYMSMIDQTTLGHRFLKEEFGYVPTVGWQIDPFGHSSTHASLLCSEVGFDSLFFGRIDYEDFQQRTEQRRLEFVWRGTASLPDAQVFTGIFSDGNYGYPSGFCFDWLYCNEDAVMDDPILSDYNADAWVEKFVQAILTEQSKSVGQNIAFKMGSDFHYSNADAWYKNLDKIIALTNKKYGDKYNVFYSDPTTFTKAKAAEKIQWTLKTDDFFPYADCENCYWSGYFTSRPTLKYIERISSSYLQVLKQFSAQAYSKMSAMVAPSSQAILADPSNTPPSSRKTFLDSNPLLDLTAAVGLVNHHDAVTGTSKQHVAYDYTRILARALTTAEQMVADTVRTFLKLAPSRSSDPADQPVQVCRAVNESVCDFTQKLVVGSSALVLAYNPLPRPNTQLLEVVINPDLMKDAYVYVTAGDYNFGTIESLYAEILPPVGAGDATSNSLGKNAARLYFLAKDVPALSSKQFLVRVDSRKDRDPTESAAVVLQEEAVPTGSDLTLTTTSKAVTVVFDGKSGTMKQISRTVSTPGLSTKISSQVTQDFGYYVGYGSVGLPSQGLEGTFPQPKPHNRSPTEQKNKFLTDQQDISGQNSGAYIFRPANYLGQDYFPVDNGKGGVASIKAVHGKLVSEARQVFNNWVTQVVRVVDGERTVDLDWTVGPVPLNDNLGKEVITRFSSDVASGDEFFTDSNGREMLKRVRDQRSSYDFKVTEPIAGNFYPVTASAFIKGGNAQLSVLTDRSQAMASLKSGEMEFMIHRRLTKDDARGVDEPLDETDGGVIQNGNNAVRLGNGIVVSGRTRLLLSAVQLGNSDLRSEMDRQYNQLALFYAALDKTAQEKREKELLLTPLPSSLGLDLPTNVQLITLESWDSNTYLLRLGHAFGVGEDAQLAVDATVDIKALLAPLLADSPDAQLVEMSLSANQGRADMLAKKIQWQTQGSSGSSARKATRSLAQNEWMTTLSPMQVKTFMITH